MTGFVFGQCLYMNNVIKKKVTKRQNDEAGGDTTSLVLISEWLVHSLCTWGCTKSGLEKQVDIFSVTRKSKHSMHCTPLLLHVFFLFLFFFFKLLLAITFWA